MPKFARAFAVFAVGFFAIASQTLLFREFIGAFESNDIAVGMFFGSWFLWIALAAWLSVRLANRFAKFADWTPFVILSYIPAFLLQFLLILNIRRYAGIEVYELFPLWKMMFWSLVANAPLSFVTGFVFPLACKWIRESGKLPVADVYIFESAGSFVGGLAVTFMLVAGCNTFLVFFVTALILAVSICLLNLKNYAFLILALALATCVVFRADAGLIGKVRIAKWARLLPPESYKGAFQTSQAEYLYGNYGGQWTVFREGGACEAIPDAEGAWKIIAPHLAQNPRAEKVLVIGSGLNLCREFLRIPQICDVTWAHYDSEYVSKLNGCLPAELAISDRRLHLLEKDDVRKFLASKKDYYDIVIANVPDVTTSILNRYFTLEFNRLVKNAIAVNGLFGIRLSGGENTIGPELAFIGASAMETLGRTFARLEIVPGDTTWVLASDSPGLTGDPEMLVNRLASVDGVSGYFPPEGLLSLYIPDRAEMAVGKYKSVKVPEAILLNTDAKPPAYLFGLLLSARQSGIGLTGLVEKLLGRGIVVPSIPLAACLLLLTVYVLRNRGEKKIQGRILGMWVIFGAGFVSIGTVIALMYLFQTSLGSLYLNIGVVSAVFMLGLAFGAAIAGRLFSRTGIEPGLILDLSATLHVAVLFWISCLQMSDWTYGVFIMAFAACGACSGLYFPAAAYFLRESGHHDLESGGMLETSDHIGAALGAFLCGVLVIPVWGAGGALILFMMFVITFIPVSLVCRIGKAASEADAAAQVYRIVGYCLFGIAAAAMIWSGMFSAETVSSLPRNILGHMKPLAGDIAGGAYLAAALTAAIIVSYMGGFAGRSAIILLTLALGGIILGVQYSTTEILALASFKAGLFHGALSLFMALLVPIAALVAGNYYCGYVCPFGALQELASHIVPGRFKPVLDDRAMLAGRQVKYLLLFVLVLLFCLSGNVKVAIWDPLAAFFSVSMGGAVLTASCIAIAGSLFYFRFWCRYICPTGAFLSLCGTVCLLRRHIPFRIFRNCEMGVRRMREMDCISCDRCRPEFRLHGGCCGTPAGGSAFAKLLARVFLFLVIASALALAAYSICEFRNSFKGGGAAVPMPETKKLQIAPTEAKQLTVTEKAPSAEEEFRPGTTRDVNLDKINRMIKAGKLSDREAEFYRKME